MAPAATRSLATIVAVLPTRPSSVLAQAATALGVFNEAGVVLVSAAMPTVWPPLATVDSRSVIEVPGTTKPLNVVAVPKSVKLDGLVSAVAKPTLAL